MGKAEYFILILTGIYLAAMALSDGKNKKIPIFPGIICMTVVIAFQVINKNSPEKWLPGIIIGIFIYIISLVSRGQVGMGDGFVYLVSGVALGFGRNLELFAISLLLASVVALYLIVVKKAGRKARMPFIPFTAIAYGVVMMI